VTLPKVATRFCFYCWHGSCDSCSYGACDCWCCPKDSIGPPQFHRQSEFLCLPERVRGVTA
jgi:hypothetical protein